MTAGGGRRRDRGVSVDGRRRRPPDRGSPEHVAARHLAGRGRAAAGYGKNTARRQILVRDQSRDTFNVPDTACDETGMATVMMMELPLKM